MRTLPRLALVLLAAAAPAQDAPPRAAPVARPLPPDVEWLDQPPPDAAALAASPAAFAELLEKNGLSLDMAGGTLAVRGSVLHDEESLGGYPVEYLVVTERNTAARNLYRSEGLEQKGGYHYRVRSTMDPRPPAPEAGAARVRSRTVGA